MSLPHLAERLRLRRAERELSVRRAAKLAGVNRDTWRMWEAGRSRPSIASHSGVERAMRWEPGSVASLLAGGEPLPPPPDYRDQETGEDYTDPVERGLWDLRHQMAMLYVDAYGPQRARALGEGDAREHIRGHRENQAKLQRMADPPNPRPAQVA